MYMVPGVSLPQEWSVQSTVRASGSVPVVDAAATSQRFSPSRRSHGAEDPNTEGNGQGTAGMGVGRGSSAEWVPDWALDEVLGGQGSG